MNDYKGFNVRPISPVTGLPEDSGELQQPGYYQLGKDLTAYSNTGFGRFGIAGPIAGLIGGAMTGPYDRQAAFRSEMFNAGLAPNGPQGQPQAAKATATTGRLAGAVNLGNGLIGLPNGDVMDHTGTVVGGAWQGVVGRNNEPIGWGVGVSPNRNDYSHEAEHPSYTHEGFGPT